MAPAGITSTGWPAVEHTCRVKLGITFDPWQHGAGRLILAKRADGKLACMIGGVGMSLPRQVGKTYLIGSMVFALCINSPGMLVIWSAHHARTHGETFLAMQAFADRAKVKPYIDRVYTGSGDEEIRFLNGSRILFGARERGFGRGIPGVDMIVSDEAQIMSDKALDAQLATMNTSRFGLAIYVGTPPRPDDPSEAFTRMRTEAWKGELRDAAWIEFGANPEGNTTDRSQWAVANPSYPHRTPAESILRLQRKLKPDSFLREGLGIWDDANDDAAIPYSAWMACADPESVALDPVVFGIDVSPDRSRATISAVGKRADGRRHVAVVDARAGVDWLVPRCVELLAHNPSGFALDPAGPVGSLIQPLRDAGIDVVEVTVRPLTQACGQLHDLVMSGEIAHRDEGLLNEAVAGAARRNVGEAWAWARKDARADITPLYAATVALWAFGEADKPADPGVWFI